MTLTDAQVVEMLDRLAEARAEMDRNNRERQDEYDRLVPQIPPELKAKMDAVNERYMEKNRDVSALAADLEKDIRAAVIASGKSIKGAVLHAVFAKGRVSWDAKLLEGLMIAVPQLEKARSVGEPSVSIRAIAKGGQDA
jgi:hypothetical protein